MSASYFGHEIKTTKRFRLGKLLSRLTHHFVLLTATPHNGKEADFQLFLSLLDRDRFEDKYRKDVHKTLAPDLMRRAVKEDIVRFDGTRLFPEHRAYTVHYELANEEAILNEEVTNCVRNEFDRAERRADGGGRVTIGFALTILQRRLASSPKRFINRCVADVNDWRITLPRPGMIIVPSSGNP